VTAPSNQGCAAVRDALPELALGTLSGVERATALAHVQACPDCGSEVDRLSSAADAVLLLAPELEPSAGFESRLFERMGVRPRRRRWLALPRRATQRAAIAAGAALAALGLGLGLGLSGGGGLTATAPIGVDLTSAHVTVGEVYLTPGNPGWVFMSVNHLHTTGLVTCRVTTVRGTNMTVGSFWVEGGAASWVSRLPVPPDQVRSAWIEGADGRVLASATVVR
jgi:anti-sigma-K factor RskA